MSEVPESHYARTVEGTYLAYQVLGEGPIDLVFPLNGGQPIDLMWEEPVISSFMQRLASFTRVITFDPRGFGSSGHIDPRAVPAMQTWMDDIGAVMDTIGSAKAALLAYGESGLAVMLFAATYPQRVLSLALVNTFARYQRSDDCPWGMPTRSIPVYYEALRELWGTGGVTAFLMPSLVESDGARRRWALQERLSATPDVGVIPRAFWESDVTEVLPTIGAPTLVVSREGDRHILPQHSRYLASRIPGAKLIELPGSDHLPFGGRSDEILDEVEEFITGARPSAVSDRLLATVLFTDIVGSTQKATDLGDRRWRELLDRHNWLVREELKHFRGIEIDTAGDSFLATFDGPARAVQAAKSICKRAPTIGIEIRAGLHTGEIERVGNDIAGIAVHIGARVSSLAGPGEVLVSRTVTDLVVGSGLEFEDRGEHELKGVPGTWRLFAVKG